MPPGTPPIESALSGVTLVTDMYYHEDEVAHAVAKVGIRGVLGETVMRFPVVDAAQPYGGLAYAAQIHQGMEEPSAHYAGRLHHMRPTLCRLSG